MSGFKKILNVFFSLLNITFIFYINGDKTNVFSLVKEFLERGKRSEHRSTSLKTLFLSLIDSHDCESNIINFKTGTDDLLIDLIYIIHNGIAYDNNFRFIFYIL